MRSSVAIGAFGLLGFAALGYASAVGLQGMPRPELGLERTAGSVRSNSGSVQWRADYVPAEDRSRLIATLDRDSPIAVNSEDGDGIVIELEGLDPGVHFIELTMERRGGRQTRITDEVAAGPWQSDRERGCDLSLALSSEGLRQLLLPVLETKIVEGAKRSEYFGTTSYLARSDLAIVDGGLRFDVALDTREKGKGDIRVAGVVDLRGQGEAGITAALRRLDTAVPGPKLEEIAKAQGRRKLGAVGVTVGTGVVAVAGGGTVLGIAAGLGGGWLGGKLGEKVGESTVKREARREARDQIESALRQATDALRLPEAVTILPTDEPLQADVRWCSPPTLSEAHGLRASLRLHFAHDASSASALEQTVYLGTELPSAVAPTSGDANVHVDVSGDFVNRLLSEWVVRGGLQKRLDRSRLREEIQAAFGERTRWQVTALQVERAPQLVLRGDGTIDATISGVTVGLHDPLRDVERTVVLGGRGLLSATPEAEPGRLRLGGTLDTAYLGCRERDGPREWRRPCFSAVLDPQKLRATLNEQLRERSDALPVLNLAALLALELRSGSEPRALTVESFALQVADGTLSIDAQVR